MGYFDALTSSAFKTTEDGRRMFFPWDTLGHGYAIGSEEEFERLRRSVKIYMVVSLPLTIAFVVWGGALGGIAILPIVIVPYVIWVRMQLRRLAQTNEKLTLRESFTTQARTHSRMSLWCLEISSVLFVLGGLFIVVADPASWLVALGAIVFFGLCAVTFGWMLIAQGGSPGRR